MFFPKHYDRVRQTVIPKLFNIRIFLIVMGKTITIDIDDEPFAAVAADTVRIGKQALVFVSSRRSAEKSSEKVASALRKIKFEPNKDLEELSHSILHALSTPTKQCERLAAVVKQGTAFHHSGLNNKQRSLVEEGFRKGIIRVICATPTLAAGVDLPSFRTIMKDVKRYTGRGMDYIPVLEYMQMAGRSGRPSYDDHGEAILLASTDNDKNSLEERYINGDPEEIYSKLAAEPALRMHVLSLFAMETVSSESDLLEFISGTFYAFQFSNIERIRLILKRIIGFLTDNGFLEDETKPKKDSEAEDLFISAKELYDSNDSRIKATTLGIRISKLYLDPLSASIIIKGLKTADDSKIAGLFSIIHLLSSCLELRPYPSVRKGDYDLLEETEAKHYDSLLSRETLGLDSDYDLSFSILKLTMAFMEWLDEKDENYLYEQYGITPGDFYGKLQIMDWLCYCSSEISNILGMRENLRIMQKVRRLLKYGVNEELLQLVSIKNIGRKRARLLYNNNIRSVSDIRQSSLSKLSSLLGEKTARSIRKMVETKEDEKNLKFDDKHFQKKL